MECELVVSWIEPANKSVHVLMFTFTLGNVVDSLIRAKGRGVDVLVVLERDQQANEPTYGTLRAAGIEVRQDNNPAFMHDKFAVIDGDVVITGSFNWMNSADEVNDENLLVIVSGNASSAFERDFVFVWQSSS
jgi:phosphatidylserine/phosphatidylglycerophosphate/cardiolipin synthase-like enzyme